MEVSDDVWCLLGAVRMIRDPFIRRDLAARRIQEAWRSGRVWLCGEWRHAQILRRASGSYVVSLSYLGKRCYASVTRVERAGRRSRPPPGRVSVRPGWPWR